MKSRFRFIPLALLLLDSIALSAEAAAAGGTSGANRLGDLRGVWRAAFNQDASRVLVRLRGGEIALWEVATGTEMQGELASPATGFWMNRTGSLAAVGSAEGTRVFDATSARAVSPLLAAKLQDELPVPATFSPDGETLVIFEPEQASIWKVRSGERRASIPFPAGPHEEAPATAIFTTQGAECYLMDPAGTVTLYETKDWTPTGAAMRHPRLDSAYEFAAAASDDGKWLATFDDAGENGPQGQLQLWDARTSKKLGAPLANTNGFTARFLGRSDRVLILPTRGEATVRALPSIKVLYKIPMHDEIDGPRVELSPDEKWAVSWGSDKVLTMHDASTGKVLGASPAKATIMQVLMAPDSSACFVVYDNSAFATEDYQDYYVSRLTLPDLTVSGTHRSLEFVRGTTLSPDGRRLLLLEGGDNAERLVILDAVNLKPVMAEN